MDNNNSYLEKENSNESDELRDIAPFLSDLKKQNRKEPFSTPQFYFDNLADRVLAQTQHPLSIQQAPSAQKGALGQLLEKISQTLWQPRLAMAFGAVLIMVCAGSFWFFNTKTNARQTNDMAIVLSDLTQEEVSEYVNENIDDFDDELFIETKGEYTVTTDAKPIFKIEDDAAIEEYLNDNIDGVQENDLEATDSQTF